MRAFIAIPCPDELKEGMVEIQENIKDLGKLTLVKPENIHLTMKFLGEVDEDKISDITKRLEFLSDLQGFDISLKGVGTFPNMNYIRVIWVGMGEGADRITTIHSEIDRKLNELNFKKDKNFHPHLTIARVKFLKKKEELRDILQKNSARDFGSFKADRIELMQSRLSPRGPEYSVIHETRFK